MNIITKWLHKEQKPYKATLGKVMASRAALDIHSSTWLFVKKWAIDELKTLRENNDNITLDKVKTAVIRGKIKNLKSILALGDKNVT